MPRNVQFQGVYQSMGCLPKIDSGASCEDNFAAIKLKMFTQPISYRFFYEATIIISSRFIFEATGAYPCSMTLH